MINGSPLAFHPEVWPPRRGLPRKLVSIGIVCQRLLQKDSRLIWFRDRFGDHDLGVSFTREGKTLAYRWWPSFRLVELHENGTITSMEPGQARYCEHWIAFRDTDKIYMFMKNSDIYNLPFDPLS